MSEVSPLEKTRMEHESPSQSASTHVVQPKRVYVIVAACLALGLGVGYVCGGLQTFSSQSVSAAHSSGSPANTVAARVPTLDDMRRRADKQSAPLLDKLKASPNDSALLSQVGAIYHGNHQFKEAAAYYERAVQADPKDLALRNKLASSLYRSGNIDGAIAQLSEALRQDPGDANSLFNLGMIRLQGKGDGQGALAAWQQLLKSNPELSSDRKAEVQKLMADVMTSLGNQPAAKGAIGK